MKDSFGKRLRGLREKKHLGLSLRKLAERAGIGPGYLSAIERDEERASVKTILALAKALGESPDVLLAMDGRVSQRLLDIICKRPELFADLIEMLDKIPDYALVKVVREVRDGKW